jgi:hypothetical protein
MSAISGLPKIDDLAEPDAYGPPEFVAGKT